MAKYLYLPFLCFLLVGCGYIQHKSDTLERKSVPAICSNLSVKQIWSQNYGDGIVQNFDTKLKLVKTGNTLYMVDYLGNLYAIDAKDGEQLWQMNVDSGIIAGPALSGNKILVVANGGKVIAIETNKRKVAWKSSASSEVLAVPKISMDMVFVPAMDGSISSLSLIDGRQLWRYTNSQPALVLRRSATPAVSNDYVVAGFANGKITALKVQDGNMEWSQEVGQPRGRNELARMVDISADPMIKGDTVYAVSYQGNLIAADLNTGNLKWERDISSFSGFATDNKFIYVSQTDGNVVAVDLISGGTFWLQDELQGRLLSQPEVMGKFVVLGDDEGNVYWLNKDSGKLEASIRVDKRGIEAKPIVDKNIVYVLGRGGKLAALELN